MPSGGHAATLHSHKSLADRSRMGSSKQINTMRDNPRRNQVNIKGLRVDLPLDDEDYLVPSPQSPQQQLPAANTPTNNNCNAYMDLIADPGPALNSASSVKIVAGDHRLSSDDGTEQERDVTEVRQHESYFGSSNDVCMLTLAEPLEFNDVVSAVNMPTQDQEFEIGSQATLSGWGALGSSQSSPDELYFNPNNEVVSDEQCQEMYNQIGLGSYFVPEDEFCAGLDGASACYGDSGGPLVCEEDRKLCGVVSWGYDCNTKVAPAVYAQAAHYVDWFIENSA